MPTASPLRRPPTQARSRQRVSRIVDAAGTIVEEQGVAAATVRAIADRAGVSPATLYQFFANRDAVLEQLLGQELEVLDARLADALAERPASSVREAVDALFDVHERHYLDRPALVALYYSARESGAVRAEVQAHLARLAAAVYEVMVSAKLLRPGTERRVVDIAIALGDRIFELAYRDIHLRDDAVIAEGKLAITSYLQAHESLSPPR